MYSGACRFCYLVLTARTAQAWERLLAARCPRCGRADWAGTPELPF